MIIMLDADGDSDLVVTARIRSVWQKDS